MTVEDNDPLASKPAALSTLFEVLMQQNIVTSEESYLALKCISVPPTEEEFVRAVQRTIAASATAPVQSGQWVHCSPALIKAGVSCANTPRRACACDPENVGHDHFIAHIAAPAQSCEQADEAGTDTDRLNFMLENHAFTVRCNRDGSILQYQLMTQDEDENYHVLHDEHRFYNTEREAIDAAIDAARAKDSK